LRRLEWHHRRVGCGIGFRRPGLRSGAGRDLASCACDSQGASGVRMVSARNLSGRLACVFVMGRTTPLGDDPDRRLAEVLVGPNADLDQAGEEEDRLDALDLLAAHQRLLLAIAMVRIPTSGIASKRMLNSSWWPSGARLGLAVSPSPPVHAALVDRLSGLFGGSVQRLPRAHSTRPQSCLRDSRPPARRRPDRVQRSDLAPDRGRQ